MTNNNDTAPLTLLANEAGYDPIEDRLRENIRATIEAVFEEELEAFLGRCRYDRGTAGVCQRCCPPISCGVSDFRDADFGFWVKPDGSGGLPVAGFA